MEWADAVVLGSPSRYGNLASPLKSYVETLEAVEGRRLGKIVWSGFASDDGALADAAENRVPRNAAPTADFGVDIKEPLDRSGAVVSDDPISLDHNTKVR